ncbi:C2H2 type zinc-finger-domain-containing protein [Coniella lustricola]|uniref:C2H2 type zinc-finger-domain-containing protein n=1 Tax=Coniella lustricola TaxID=2025994 RepID=A0A2T2ZY48_9PEZI|nr:C2H2 type zinc-finger-domain-containing protein [Coniella lustricola]
MATISGSRGAAPTQDTSASHPYTCNTCQVAFRNSDLQKGHMRSDWHRYNLKRRVASLPPISSETFTEKVLQARATSTAEAERAGWQKECTVCHRTYYSENSYQNHIGSQKHKAKEAAVLRGQSGAPAIPDDASSIISSTFSLGEPVPSARSDVDSEAEDEFQHIVEGMKKAEIRDRPSPVKRPSNPAVLTAVQQDDQSTSGESSEQQTASATPVPSTAPGAPAAEVSLKSCLFCNLESADVAANTAHMERSHGMFIPEKQYLVNLEGLLASLQQQIQEYNECVYCHKVKANAFAVQTHMRDTAHCKIPYSTEEEQLEIGEFYDFRSTYSDGDEDMDSDDDDDESVTNGGARLGGKRAAVITNEDGEEMEEGGDEGWETDSSASSLDSADLTAVPAENHYHQYERLEKHPHHSRSDSRPHLQKDGFHSHSHKPTRAVFYDEYELHLPNGKSVGHRSLNKYFRQNLRDYPTPDERAQRQLAIENGEDSDDMDVDGDEQGSSSRQMVHRGRQRDQNRQLASRAEGGSGMLGVSDKKKQEVRKAELRSRKNEQAAQKRYQWSLNKGANHQKYYNYQIL